MTYVTSLLSTEPTHSMNAGLRFDVADGFFLSASESPFYGLRDRNGTQGQDISFPFYICSVNDFKELFIGLFPVKKVQTKPAWRRLAETGMNNLSILEIKSIIEDLSLALSKNNWDLINSELEIIDISRMGEDAIVTVTRTLFPASHMLPCWKNFIGKIYSTLEERSINTVILRGLI